MPSSPVVCCLQFRLHGLLPVSDERPTSHRSNAALKRGPSGGLATGQPRLHAPQQAEPVYRCSRLPDLVAGDDPDKDATWRCLGSATTNLASSCQTHTTPTTLRNRQGDSARPSPKRRAGPATHLLPTTTTLFVVQRPAAYLTRRPAGILDTGYCPNWTATNKHDVGGPYLPSIGIGDLVGAHPNTEVTHP